MPNGLWDKDTFLMDVPEADRKRVAMTFDMLKSIDERLQGVCMYKTGECEHRFVKLERRKWFDKGLSLFGGFVGGMAGFFGLKST